MLSRIAGILFGVAVSLLLAVIVSLPAEGPQCLIWPKSGPGLLGPAPMLKVEESNSGYMSKSIKALTALSPQSQLEAHVWNGFTYFASGYCGMCHCRQPIEWPAF